MSFSRVASFDLFPVWSPTVACPDAQKLCKACPLGCLQRSGLAASALWYGVARLLPKILSQPSRPRRQRHQSRHQRLAGRFCRLVKPCQTYQTCHAGSAKRCTDARSESITSAARCTRSRVVLLLATSAKHQRGVCCVPGRSRRSIGAESHFQASAHRTRSAQLNR